MIVRTEITEIVRMSTTDPAVTPITTRAENRQCVWERENLGKLSSCVDTCTTLSVRKLISTSSYHHSREMVLEYLSTKSRS